MDNSRAHSSLAANNLAQMQDPYNMNHMASPPMQQFDFSNQNDPGAIKIQENRVVETPNARRRRVRAERIEEEKKDLDMMMNYNPFGTKNNNKVSRASLMRQAASKEQRAESSTNRNRAFVGQAQNNIIGNQGAPL